MRKLFTSESVTEGHPDKLCDQISDAVLDAILAQDPQARVACETFATTGMITVMGEITTSAYVEIPDIARAVVLDVGYDSSEKFFDGASCGVMTAIHAQSPDIAQGVNQALEGRAEDAGETGAGDQGMMFGYACDETPEYLPMPIALSHRLARRLTEVRKNGTLPWLRPDGKSQVTIAYEDDRPAAVDTVVISTQHAAEVSQEEIREAIMKYVILPVIPEELLKPECALEASDVVPVAPEFWTALEQRAQEVATDAFLQMQEAYKQRHEQQYKKQQRALTLRIEAAERIGIENIRLSRIARLEAALKDATDDYERHQEICPTFSPVVAFMTR